MEIFQISVTWDNQVYHLEIRDYMHHEGDKCKYEILRDGQFIGSLEPGAHKILHICKNPGLVDEGLLHEVAGQLEAYNV
jgi:hypothetical protein